MELSGGLGLRAAEAAVARRRRRNLSARCISNVPVLDTGARGATTTFVERGVRRRADRVGERGVSGGERARPDKVRDHRPVAISISAEPPVALVDKVVDRKGTRKVARGLPRLSLHDGRPGNRGTRISIAPPTPRWRRNMRISSRRSVSSICPNSLAIGKKRRKRISPTAVRSTRFTVRDRELDGLHDVDSDGLARRRGE